METNRSRQNKPDPALKKSIKRARIEARRNISRSKRGTPLVVSLSLAVTLFGWGLFSHHDAGMVATAQMVSATPTMASATLQEDVSSSPTQGIIVSLASSINQGVAEATVTPVPSTPQAQSATATAVVTATASATVAPVAVTRSSR